MDELLIESKKIKAAADQLLSESKLFEILGRFGRVEVTGSYAADVMMCGDIDIHVFVEKLDRREAVKALNALMEETEFLGYMFFDWIKHKNPNFPKGYYLGIKEKVSGYDKQWKIDIWFVEQAQAACIEYMNLLSSISEEEKKLILSFKKYREANCPDLSSAVIYDAVLKNGVENLEEFKKSLN